MNPYLRALDILEKGELPHIVVGGFAVVLHGVSRFTPDLNVYVDVEGLDPQFLADLLAQAEFECLRPEGLPALAEKNGTFTTVSWADRQAPGFRLDIMTKLPIPFQELQKASTKLELQGVPFQLPAITDLISLKEKAGRNQDRSDMIALRFVEQIQLFGDKAFDLPVAADEEFERPILMDFSRLSAEERLDWLSQMLSEFGKFCAI